MLSLFRRALAFVASSVADARSQPEDEREDDRDTGGVPRLSPLQEEEEEFQSDHDDESLPILQLPSVADAQMTSARSQCDAWRSIAAPEQVNGPLFDATDPAVSIMALGTLGVLQPGQTRLLQHVPTAVLTLRRPQSADRNAPHRVELVWQNRLVLAFELTNKVPFEFFPREHGISWITATGEDAMSAFYFRFQFPSEERAVRMAWSLACFETARQLPLQAVSKAAIEDGAWMARAHERVQAASSAGGASDLARSEQLLSRGEVSTRSATEALSEDDEPSSASSSDEEEEEKQASATRSANEAQRHAKQSHRQRQRRHNEHLAVTHSGERAFVTRDAQLGVFRHDSTGKLENTHVLPVLKSTAGVPIVPKQMMLHMEDSKMLFLSEHDPTRVVEFDIESGKVVQEYGKSEDFHLTRLAPVSKFAGKTGEGMIAAVNANHVLLLDGRQNGANKLAVQTEYQSVKGFSCLATTASGSLVTGSTTGVVRLFDEAGKRAKTALPGLGDGLLGIDVSADGRWILATAKSYLLLIPTETSGGSGSHVETMSGFKQSITTSSAAPIKLQLDPRDVVKYNIQDVSFRVARFSTGDHANAENWIVTSTGKSQQTRELSCIVCAFIRGYHVPPQPLSRYGIEPNPGWLCASCERKNLRKECYRG
jgi:hypothetical protein